MAKYEHRNRQSLSDPQVHAAGARSADPASDMLEVEDVRDLKHFFKPEDWCAAAATFVVSTLVFFHHMAPEVTLQDSGELVTGAFSFGVPHPPGYPLWALLGFIWSHALVPFGNPAWRIGLMSVFTGGLVVGVMTLMMTRSTRVLLHALPWSDRLEERLLHWIALAVGVSTALLFGFNRGVWLWASVSEMRVLNVFSFVLMGCTFFGWLIQPRRTGFLYATLVIFGLSMTNHQTVSVMAGALVAGTLAEGLDRFCLRRAQLHAPSGFARNCALLMESLATFLELAVAVLFSAAAGFLLFGWLKLPDLGPLFAGRALAPDIWRTSVLAGVPLLWFIGFHVGRRAGWLPKLGALAASFVLLALYWRLSTDPLIPAAQPPAAHTPDVHIALACFVTAAVLLFLGDLVGWIRVRQALKYTLCFLGGCAFYLYMPIAAWTNPPMNWGYAGTKEGFLHAITRGQYEKLKVADLFNPEFLTKIKVFVFGLAHQYSWTLCAFGLVTILVASIWMVMGLRKRWWTLIVWAVAFACILGALVALRELLGQTETSASRAALWAAVLATLLCMLIDLWLYLRWPGGTWMIFVWAAFLVTSLGLLTVINPKLDRQEQEITIKFFAPAHGFYAMLIGYGIALTFGFALRAWRRMPHALVYVCCAGLLALPFITYSRNWNLCALEKHDFGYQFGYRMFRPGGGYPDMERDAVLYGGTDPGRFVPTYMIFCESRVRPQDRFRDPTFDRSDVYIITQNALADNTYMSYIRDHYDVSRPTNNASLLQRWLKRDQTYPQTPIFIPGGDDSARAFQQFVADVQSGRTPAGADVKVENGRVSVTGVQGVMAINGILAKWIFDRNKERHAFYVEESYVIPWMYPYLRPSGVIMKIEKDPLPAPRENPALWQEIVTRDTAYWDALTREFLAREEFRRSNDARKSFSKLRSAIAGLYLSRGMLPEAEYAFRQSLELCPESPEGCFRLAELCMQQRRFDDARKILEAYQALDPYNGSARGFLQQINEMSRRERRRIELEQTLPQGADLNAVLELITLYAQLNQTPEFVGLAMRVLDTSNLPPPAYLQVAQVCGDARRPDLAGEAISRYLRVDPLNFRIWIELAVAQFSANQAANAQASLRKAVDTGGETARAALRTDPRFAGFRDDPEFRSLTQPAAEKAE